MIGSFYPVVAGRVSDPLVRNRTLFQVQTDQFMMQRLQTQLSTGLKFTRPSESPVAAVRLMGIQRELEFKNQTLNNLSSSRAFLNITETNLSNVSNILNEVRGLAVQANTTTLSDSDRQGLIAQIDGYLNRLVAVGNQRTQERFLFSGGNVDQQPLQQFSNSIVFNGNQLDLMTIAGSQDYISHNVTSQQALGVISDASTTTIDLNPSITPSTRLTDLLRGQGISRGAIQFSNGDEQVLVDLSSAHTVQDVLDRLNQLSVGGRPIDASLGPNGLQVQYADGLPGTLRISNLGPGSTASDLGIATSLANPPLPIIGSDLNPILSATTRIDQLNGGLGIDFSDGITIHQGNRQYQVDFSTAETIEDLVVAIRNSGARVRVEIDSEGRGMRIRSIESGVDFSISEQNGDLADRIGLKTFHGNLRLDELNFGRGVFLSDGDDLIFTRSDGSEFRVNLSGSITVQDAIDAINNHPDNQDPDLRIEVEIAPQYNGLRLRASVPPIPLPPDPPPQPIRIQNAGGSNAAIGLGLVPRGETSVEAQEVNGEFVISGADPNPREVEGIYNSLLRLRQAIEEKDYPGIDRATNLLDGDLERLTLARGDIGIRQQRITALTNSIEDQILQLTTQASDLQDVDFAQVVSELNGRSAAYQANLQLLAQSTRMTIFNFI